MIHGKKTEKKTERKERGEKLEPRKRGGIWIDPMCFPYL